MHVVIMAAGRGKRLGQLTADFPKALIEVASMPLVGHALRFARQAGGDPRVVVGGFCYEQLAAGAKALDPEAVLVENTELHAGNLLSLVAGLTAVPAGAGFLLMNADHIYPRTVAEIVKATVRNASEVTAFCDFDRLLSADDMKVRLDDAGHVAAMAKTLDAWDGGYVGMTWIPSCRRAAYDSAIRALRLDEGADSAVEEVLVRLVKATAPPAHADISGHRWFEVDEPRERDSAEAGLAGPRGREPRSRR